MIALYLYTERWQRDQAAERLIDRAYQSGSKEAADELLREARRLREPPVPAVEQEPLPPWLRPPSLNGHAGG